MSFPFRPITFLHHFTMAVKQHRVMWAPGNHSLKGAALPLPSEHSLADQGAPAPATEPLLSSIRGHTCPPLKERDQVLLLWCRPEVLSSTEPMSAGMLSTQPLAFSLCRGPSHRKPMAQRGPRSHGCCSGGFFFFFFFFNADWRSSQGFPGGSVVKKPPANAGDVGLIPRLGRSSGRGNGNPF